jgi:hypothetical protein
MRPWTLAAVTLAVVSIGIAFASGAFRKDSKPHVAPPPQPNAAEKAAIRQAVLKVAAQLGEPKPTHGVLVPTTTRSAGLVEADASGSDTPVYFVLVHGQFTDKTTSTKGTLLALTIDPDTNKVLQAGFVGSTPNLKAIGRPEVLPLPADS